MGGFFDGVSGFFDTLHGISNAGWKAVMDLVGLDEGDAKRFQSMLSDVPVIGDFLRLEQNSEKLDDYLENRGLDWSDVKYPALQRENGVGAVLRSASSFVSKNIERLYDDH